LSMSVVALPRSNQQHLCFTFLISRAPLKDWWRKPLYASLASDRGIYWYLSIWTSGIQISKLRCGFGGRGGSHIHLRVYAFTPLRAGKPFSRLLLNNIRARSDPSDRVLFISRFYLSFNVSSLLLFISFHISCRPFRCPCMFFNMSCVCESPRSRPPFNREMAST